jgi:hypothetical protein
MNTQTLVDSYELYKQTHEQKPKYFKGYSLQQYVFEIGSFIQRTNIRTLIDYGCGKAGVWNDWDLKDLWKLDEVVLWDPGVEEYITKPTEPRDLVICIDVLEHVPEHLVDEVLADMCSLANKAIFCNVSTRPASKHLIDGSNAHATVQPAKWWQAKFDALDKLVIAHFTT